MDCVLLKILEQISDLLSCKNGFVYLEPSVLGAQKLFSGDVDCFKGMGTCEGYHAFGEQTFQILKAEEAAAVRQQEQLLIVPLFSENHQLFGILAAENCGELHDDRAQLFEVYSKQVASVLNTLIFSSLLQLQNRELGEAYASLRQTYMGTIDAMRQMVDAKDLYTRGHSDRVSFYAVKIAEAMHRDEASRERLRVAGLFHDIGKVGIPDSILQKNGKLTTEEYAQIKQHPSLGKKMLSSISAFNDILCIVECHHERYDGRGYPHGRKGTEIPEEARIISVADSFDAMTSKRTYRDSLNLFEAVWELKNGRGTQFDPQVVDVFLEVLQQYEALREEIAWTFPEAALEEGHGDSE